MFVTTTSVFTNFWPIVDGEFVNSSGPKFFKRFSRNFCDFFFGILPTVDGDLVNSSALLETQDKPFRSMWSWDLLSVFAYRTKMSLTPTFTKSDEMSF